MFYIKLDVLNLKNYACIVLRLCLSYFCLEGKKTVIISYNVNIPFLKKKKQIRSRLPMWAHSSPHVTRLCNPRGQELSRRLSHSVSPACFDVTPILSVFTSQVLGLWVYSATSALWGIWELAQSFMLPRQALHQAPQTLCSPKRKLVPSSSCPP